MSVFINKDTKVIVQGITGSTAMFHTKQMLRIRNENCWWCHTRKRWNRS